ncbi:MAG: hypothetical protein ACYS6W_17075, partial [Planctomycetota bacterium]
MGVNDALTAQGMATFHKRSVTPVVKGIGHINALLRRMIKGKAIEYSCYGDGVDWYVEKLDETAEWNSGQLGTRTFEEKDPVAKATLEMCFLDRTYGVSEKSIKTNRAAGIAQVYKIQKKNAEVAQSAMYRAIVTALYSSSDGTVANGPAGLREICSDPLETTSKIAVSANTTYAGLTNSGTSAISAYAKNKASYANKYWAPENISVHEVPGAASSPKWSTDCLIDLAFMSIAMGRTKDISGTGKIIKPDLALMNVDPFQAVWAKMLTDRSSAGPINLSDTDFDSVGIKNVIVGPITVVYDENVPDDANTTALEVVYVVDSKAFKVHTCNTKSEGLIEGQWQGNTNPEIIGGVGVYKSNMCFVIDSPV